MERQTAREDRSQNMLERRKMADKRLWWGLWIAVTGMIVGSGVNILVLFLK